MRLVYCPTCQHVSMKSRYERDACESCGGRAREVRVPRPWQYWAGAIVILAGAAFMLLPQVTAGLPWAPLVESLALRLVWLVVFVGLGLYLSMWGVRVMKATALERGRAASQEAKA